MTIEFECGVDPARLSRWFAENERPDVAMTLEELSGRKLGPVKLPRTMVRIEGDPSAEQSLYDAFYLQFMSAGG